MLGNYIPENKISLCLFCEKELVIYNVWTFDAETDNTVMRKCDKECALKFLAEIA